MTAPNDSPDTRRRWIMKVRTIGGSAITVAAAISVPSGILAAAYLALFGPDTRAASAARFAAKQSANITTVLTDAPRLHAMPVNEFMDLLAL